MSLKGAKKYVGAADDKFKKKIKKLEKERVELTRPLLPALNIYLLDYNSCS